MCIECEVAAVVERDMWWISSPLRDACLHYAGENRHQLIEKLAYARYERTGCTDAFVNWLWAERVLDGKLVGWEEQKP
jgi:hypothetical protein